MRANSDSSSPRQAADWLSLNPFAMLGVTTRDDRRKIMAQAEERGLQGNQAQWGKARSELIHPRSRLFAEITWFAGTDPSVVSDLLALLDTHPFKTLQTPPSGVSDLACANLMVVAFDRLQVTAAGPDVIQLSEAIQTLCVIAEKLQAPVILEDINRDRALSGFPRVQDKQAVEEGLVVLRKQYRDVLMNLLDRMPAKQLVETMFQLVSRSTMNGTHSCTSLIDDLVDAYALETQALLESEREHLVRMAAHALAAAPEGEGRVAVTLEQMLAIVRQWCRIARPIQLSMKARGMANRHSEQLAAELRELGVELFNRHDMHAVSVRLIGQLLELFANVPSSREQLQADALRLQEIEQERQKLRQWDEQWRRAISFSAELGKSKSVLKIDAEGVFWKDRHWRLSDITRVRWGRSLGGMLLGASYVVELGDAKWVVSVPLQQDAVYKTFTDSLWHAVCVRLMYEMANALRAEAVLTFGPIRVEDDAVQLQQQRFLGEGEWTRLIWNEVRVSSDGDNFIIESKAGGLKASASYLKEWNVHVLERVVRAGLHKGTGRLSDYLEETAASQ